MSKNLYFFKLDSKNNQVIDKTETLTEKYIEKISNSWDNIFFSVKPNLVSIQSSLERNREVQNLIRPKKLRITNSTNKDILDNGIIPYLFTHSYKDSNVKTITEFYNNIYYPLLNHIIEHDHSINLDDNLSGIKFNTSLSGGKSGAFVFLINYSLNIATFENVAKSSEFITKTGLITTIFSGISTNPISKLSVSTVSTLLNKAGKSIDKKIFPESTKRILKYYLNVWDYRTINEIYCLLCLSGKDSAFPILYDIMYIKQPIKIYIEKSLPFIDKYNLETLVSSLNLFEPIQNLLSKSGLGELLGFFPKTFYTLANSTIKSIGLYSSIQPVWKEIIQKLISNKDNILSDFLKFWIPDIFSKYSEKCLIEMTLIISSIYFVSSFTWSNLTLDQKDLLYLKTGINDKNRGICVITNVAGTQSLNKYIKIFKSNVDSAIIENNKCKLLILCYQIKCISIELLRIIIKVQNILGNNFEHFDFHVDNIFIPEYDIFYNDVEKILLNQEKISNINKNNRLKEIDKRNELQTFLNKNKITSFSLKKIEIDDEFKNLYKSKTNISKELDDLEKFKKKLEIDDTFEINDLDEIFILPNISIIDFDLVHNRDEEKWDANTNPIFNLHYNKNKTLIPAVSMNSFFENLFDEKYEIFEKYLVHNSETINNTDMRNWMITINSLLLYLYKNIETNEEVFSVEKYKNKTWYPRFLKECDSASLCLINNFTFLKELCIDCNNLNLFPISNELPETSKSIDTVTYLKGNYQIKILDYYFSLSELFFKKLIQDSINNDELFINKKNNFIFDMSIKRTKTDDYPLVVLTKFLVEPIYNPKSSLLYNLYNQLINQIKNLPSDLKKSFKDIVLYFPKRFITSNLNKDEDKENIYIIINLDLLFSLNIGYTVVIQINKGFTINGIFEISDLNTIISLLPFYGNSINTFFISNEIPIIESDRYFKICNTIPETIFSKNSIFTIPDLKYISFSNNNYLEIEFISDSSSIFFTSIIFNLISNKINIEILKENNIIINISKKYIPTLKDTFNVIKILKYPSSNLLVKSVDSNEKFKEKVTDEFLQKLPTLIKLTRTKLTINDQNISFTCSKEKLDFNIFDISIQNKAKKFIDLIHNISLSFCKTIVKEDKDITTSLTIPEEVTKITQVRKRRRKTTK
jgi:hypothetical protein